MRKRVLVFLSVIFIILLGAKFKEPNWATISIGTQYSVDTRPKIQTMTGIYTFNISNQTDYKQSKETFEAQALQYKSDGYIELLYESNPTSRIGYLSASERDNRAQMELPKKIEVGIPAFDQYKPNWSLNFDIANGQWLLNNGMFSRFNKELRNGTTSIYISPLEQAPWGIANSTTSARRDEFLVGLSKAAYGPIESRPIYLEVPAYRYAKKVIWNKIYDMYGNLIAYEYWEEPQFTMQQVSGSAGAPYETYDVSFRGEFVTKPESMENRIIYKYEHDMWAYVSTNIWELYFIDLLSKGILDYNEVFQSSNQNSPSKSSTLNQGPKGDTFEFNSTNSIAQNLMAEYNGYGFASSINSYTSYPAYATQLGVSLAGSHQMGNVNNETSIRDINSRILNSTSVLGRNYEVVSAGYDSSNGFNKVIIKFKGDEMSGLPETQYMENQVLTNIAALRMIERVLRVQEKNMSQLEAKIISQKYGAKYLDNITPQDRKTVEFLIAFGIIDFENFEEYANLYSVLSREFCYTLLYRVANPNARTDFSKLLLTDASIMALDITHNYNNYQNSVMMPDLSKLEKFISPDGKLVQDPSNPESPPLSIMSSIFVDSILHSDTGIPNKSNPIYHVILNIDNPLKYVYNNFPLVLTGLRADGISNGIMLNSIMSPWGSLYPEDETHIKIYPNNLIGVKGEVPAQEVAKASLNNFEIYRDVSTYPNIEGSPDITGIVDIVKIKGTDRYLVDISIATTSAESAEAFVKANLKPLTAGLFKEVPVTSVISPNNTLMISSTGNPLNDNLVTDNDVLMNTQNKASTVFVNTTEALANTIISKGDIKSEVAGNNMMSQEVTLNALTNTALDSSSNKPIYSLDSLSQLNTNEIKVVSSDNTKQEPAHMRTFNINHNQDNVHEKDNYYNVTVSNLGNVFLTNKTFMWTSVPDPFKPAVTSKVEGTVALELILDLPTLQEQTSMVGADALQLTQSPDLVNWIYTEPINPDLKLIWDYNIAVVNAIFKAMGLSNDGVRTGYVYPRLTILLDKPPTNENKPGLTQIEINDLASQFLKEVGKHLDTKWLGVYLGSGLPANQRIVDLDTTTLAKLVNDEILTRDTSGLYKLTKRPSKGVTPSLIGTQLPIWAELYFNNTNVDNLIETYYHTRITYPTFGIYPIYTFDNTDKVYGRFDPGPQSEGSSTLIVPYVKDEFNNLYMRIDESIYSYNVSANTLVLNKGSIGEIPKQGKVIKYKDKDWYVFKETDLSMTLVGLDVIPLVLQGNQLVTMDNKISVLDANKSYINSFFGTAIDPDIDETLTYHFDVPTTILPVEYMHVGDSIAFLNNNTLELYMVDVGATAPLRKKVSIIEGSPAFINPYVTLSKSTWGFSQDGRTLRWQKRFVGADYKYYTPKNNLLLLQSSVLPQTSANRLKYSDVKQAKIIMGTLTGYKQESKDMITHLPFLADFINSDVFTLNDSAIIDAMKAASLTILTSDGKAHSSYDYTTVNGVASYEPNYLYYDRTLVRNNDLLYVATSDKLEKYTPASWIKDVAVTTILDPELSLVVIKNSVGDYLSVTLDSLQDKSPPSKSSTTPAMAVFSKIDPSVIDTMANVSYRGVESAAIYYQDLIDYTNTMRTSSFLGKVVWYILAVMIFLSVALVIAYALRKVSLIHGKLYDVWDASGFDLFRWMSLTVIRVEEEPPGIFTILLYSALLSIVPMFIIALMKGFGVIFVL